MFLGLLLLPDARPRRGDLRRHRPHLRAVAAGHLDQLRERPVGVTDLFCTFCQALKINPRKENMSPVGRPIKIVDGGAPVKELFS